MAKRHSYPQHIKGEEWKEALINGKFVGVYVSNMGRCFRATETVPCYGGKTREVKGGLVPVIRKNPSVTGGIEYLRISINGEMYNIKHLIANTWLGERSSSNLVVRHIDGNPANMKVSNFAWGLRNSQRGKTEDRLFDSDGRRMER